MIGANKTDNEARIWFFLIASAFCYAFGPNGYKALMVGGLTQGLAVGVLLIIGSLMMIPIWIKASKETLLNSFKEMKYWMWLIVLLDSLLTATYFLTYVYALDHGMIVQITLLSRLAPIFVVFLASWILGENSQVQSWVRLTLALILCLIGVFAASGDSDQIFTMKINLLMAFGLLLAITDALRSTLTPLVQRTKVLPDAGIVVIVMMLAGIWSLTFNAVVDPGSRYPNLYEFGGLLLLGFATTALPRWLKLLAYTGSNKQILVTASSYSTVIFAGIIAWIWHGEAVNLVQLSIAFIVIVIGLYLLSSSFKKTN